MADVAGDPPPGWPDYGNANQVSPDITEALQRLGLLHERLMAPEADITGGGVVDSEEKD